MGRLRIDPVAAAASLLALAMVVAYLVVIQQQDGEPALWVVTALVLGAAAAGYGAVRAFRHRRLALLLAGVVLVVLGMLAIFSIGLPILLAGGLCFVAFARRIGDGSVGDSQTGGTGAS
jgi:hypothetical protein